MTIPRYAVLSSRARGGRYGRTSPIAPIAISLLPPQRSPPLSRPLRAGAPLPGQSNRGRATFLPPDLQTHADPEGRWGWESNCYALVERDRASTRGFPLATDSPPPFRR